VESGQQPQGVIRRYLDQHGGTVQVPAYNLLSTWEVPDFEGGSRERIAQALRDAGIETDPPLSQVQRDTKVTLRVRDEPVSTPPWGAPKEETQREEAQKDRSEVTAPRQQEHEASAGTSTPPAPKAAPPPGWYSNPQGAGQRYWDGSRWTDQYAPDPAPAPGKSGDAAGAVKPSARRRLPPLLSEHSRPVQVVLAGVVPALYGALTGVFLGVSEPVYLVLSLIGILGGVGAGFDHIGARAGALRGVVAGSVFGAFILIAHEIHGEEAEAHLPEPAILLVAITTGLAVPLAALGGWLRQRQERKAEVREGTAVPGPLG
jgi:Protein of unknown function (DUF2510)